MVCFATYIFDLSCERYNLRLQLDINRLNFTEVTHSCFKINKFEFAPY